MTALELVECLRESNLSHDKLVERLDSLAIGTERNMHSTTYILGTDDNAEVAVTINRFFNGIQDIKILDCLDS